MTSSAQSATANNPFVGKVFDDRFRIVELIGRGGMGLVYLAKDEQRDRQVVLKVLAPHWADDDKAIARFKREGQRLAQLSHANIVELHDIGHEDGQSYIVMEYIDGEPLRRFLARRGPLTLQEFVPIAHQILAAAGYAHSRSIMLRDIKPSNIMLCEHDGKANFVKLLDFGLAKLVDGDSIEVTKAHVIGTAGYLAPEQIKGEPYDVRVDVYALGILFFLMLSGESPILGDSDGAVLYNHVHGSPHMLSTRLPSGHKIPGAVIALIHRCLEKDPSRRPADANEIAESLFESLSPSLFKLPRATKATRQAIDDYRKSRQRKSAQGEAAFKSQPYDPAASSAEWTRPVVRELLAMEDGEAAARIFDAKASESASRLPVAPRPGTTPPSRGRRGAKGDAPTVVEPSRSSRLPTQLGLPATPTALPSGRRPPPAKTPARARILSGSQPSISMPVPKRLRGHTRAPTAALTRVEPKQEPKPRLQGHRMTQLDGSGAQPGSGMRPLPVPPKSRPTQPMHPSEDVAAKRAVDEFDDIPEPTVLEYEAPEPLPAWDTLAAGPQVGGPDFIPEFGSERYETAAPPMPIWAIAVIMVAALSLGGMLAYLWLGDAPAESLASGTRDAVQARGAEAAASDPETTPPADPVTKEPSEAPRPASMGTLRINAPAGATVFIDGEARGRGTFEGTVSIGQHFVRVLKPGFTPWEDDVTVLSTDNRPLDIDLTRVSGASSSSRPSTSPWKPGESNTAPKANTSSTGSKPVSAATPREPEAPVSPPAAPLKPSKATPTDPSKDDGVFMEPSKGKDDGIFLPVGKQK